MGQAKARGTYAERKALAIAEGRLKKNQQRPIGDWNHPLFVALTAAATAAATVAVTAAPIEI